jgi:hypothetical protein
MFLFPGMSCGRLTTKFAFYLRDFKKEIGFKLTGGN